MGSVESRWSRVVSGTQLPRIFFRDGEKRGEARGDALIHAALRPFHYRLHFIKRTSLDTGNDHRESVGERRERDLNRFTVNRFSLVDCITDNRGENLGKRRKEG